MSWVSAYGSHGKATSRWSASFSAGDDLPIIDCPFCKIPVIKLHSKQRETYGMPFYKCRNHDPDDPQSCPFYKVESKYNAYLRKKMEEECNVVHERKEKFQGVNDGGFRELKQEIIALREQNWEVKKQLVAMKQEIESMKTLVNQANRGIVLDNACVVTCCVGCILGIVIALLCKM